MTEQEIKSKLEVLKEWVGNDSLTRQDCQNAIDKAIKIVEKQMPMNLEEHNKQCGNRVFDYMDYECTKRVPYCCVCGQAIKYSEG